MYYKQSFNNSSIVSYAHCHNTCSTLGLTLNIESYLVKKMQLIYFFVSKVA